MIPFITAQFERGSGVLTQEVRPVVPSMFEQPSSPAFTAEDAGDEGGVHSPAVAESTTGNERVPERPPLDQTLISPQLASLPSRIPEPFDPPSKRSVITSVREPQANSQSTSVVFEARPLHSDLVPQLASPERVFIGRDPGRMQSPSDSMFGAEPERQSPILPLDAIQAQIDDLTQRLKVTSRQPANSPIAAIVPPSNVPDNEASQSPIKASFSSPHHEHRNPNAIFMQQPVPQINPVNTPTSAPSVTVSIGRIEFRNSARRNDSLPQPATQTPKPESRVVSLEDYLRQRLAGGT